MAAFFPEPVMRLGFNLRLARQRAMSPELVGAKKRSPLKGAPIIVRPEAWLPAIAGSSIGANGSCRPPIRSSDPKRAPAVI